MYILYHINDLNLLNKLHFLLKQNYIFINGVTNLKQLFRLKFTFNLV